MNRKQLNKNNTKSDKDDNSCNDNAQEHQRDSCESLLSQPSTFRFTKTFVCIADQYTVRQWIDMAFLSRIVILLCMAISCYTVPTLLLRVFTIDDHHNDDTSVETFPLRLLWLSPYSSSSSADVRTVESLVRPFATTNSICTNILRYRLVVDIRNGIQWNFQKADTNHHYDLDSGTVKSAQRSHFSIWSLLLTPLTRWDAARFLRLSHDPYIRYPQYQYRLQRQMQFKADRTGTEFESSSSSSSCPNIDLILQQSEEAHAFLPLYPFMIQIVVAVLLWCTPISILPSTCEGIVTLAAYLFNTICFLWSAKQLYYMTLLLLSSRNPFMTAIRTTTTTTIASTKDGTNNKSLTDPSETIIDDDSAERYARRVLLLYILNPATIFFNTSYSESFGAALIFTGYHWILQYRIAVATTTSTTTSGNHNPISFLIGTWILWYLSCFVRSNGMLNSGFLFLFGLGGMMSHYNNKSSSSLWHWFVSISVLLSSVILAIGSMGLYNYHAYRNHCLPMTLERDTLVSDDPFDIMADCPFQSQQTPEWCQFGPYFNVYSYVQRKHWNVGVFRYYKWKQLPNFILAAPVLCCSTLAVCSWILINWRRYSKLHNNERKKGLVNYTQRLVGWSTSAIQLFATNSYTTGDESRLPNTIEKTLLGEPILLGHYAVLATSTITVLTLAHVQIGTRMIFSSCPALYWYLVVVISKHRRFGEAVVCWCLIYIYLGIVMHPNLLPWT